MARPMLLHSQVSDPGGETGEMAESCDIARIGGYSRRNLQALYLEDDQRKRRRGKRKKKR